ncbi:hypothetical protein [Alteromonas oceanisediminis]|uniref:hypothetical protein n=1 Tax=Alteromonas oceanisediminis TaxID=2836180 RepID=UPI001BDAAD26|nr:hypothetical protein [Alteromonas oceanisediminis]MBT0585513.1 hypothetical protein [Alteromonas oceanisediminis]
MKEFFWAIIAVYVLLYFYAAWLYDGFNLGFATAVFIAVCAHLFWWRKRKQKQNIAKQDVSEETQRVAAPDASPISMWRSPLPYMILIVACVIVASQWG